ncbi:MAG: hypothetical protein R3D67_21860 [Hyphomicrobiaceae bacterium]
MCGSSVATASTMARVALPEMLRQATCHGLRRVAWLPVARSAS